MIEAVEWQQYGWYLRNCQSSPLATQVVAVLLRQLGEFDGSGSNDDDLPDFNKNSTIRTSGKAAREQLRDLRRKLRPFQSPPPSRENLERNALFAQEEFGLDAVDTEIFLLVLRYSRNGHLVELADDLAQTFENAPDAVSALLNLDPSEARRRVSPGGALIDFGILSNEDDVKHHNYHFAGDSGQLRLAQPLRKVMHRPFATRQEWSSSILGSPVTTSLSWEDFAHLDPERDLARLVIAGAANRGETGINLVFYGQVGTGKTELCKVLAARAGCSIWAIGEADEKDREPSRSERLAALRLSQRLLAGRRNVVLLLDEAEDVLTRPGLFTSSRRDESKVFLNRMVEDNAIPVLWTANDVGGIDPAILRRMTLAVEVKIPSPQVRERIWRKGLQKAGVALDDAAVRRLSLRYEAPAALSTTAARVAGIAGGGEAEITLAMEGILRVLGGEPRMPPPELPLFDIDLVQCDEDLGALVARLGRPGAPRRWSICLHGPSGTGKSLFARYLARQIGLEVVQKRASDLLSKWVGDSEKQIARAFAEARAEQAVLVLDEADGLLYDRRSATHGWEVSQVGELLAQMEDHPWPFICTTNLVGSLDRASLRRFTLKLRFDPLRPTQAALAFERFFGAPAPRPLPEGLTPGDFATVRGMRDVFGSAEPEQLIRWLEAEVEAKGYRIHRVGFRAGAA